MNKTMKKFTVKILIILAILSLSFACLIGCDNNGNDKNGSDDGGDNNVVVNNVVADKILINDDSFADEYKINSEITFPSEIRVEYRNETVTASNGIVFYPDGNAYYAGALKLDKFGIYTVRYYYSGEDGKGCVAEKTFTVTSGLYSVSGMGSVTAVSEQNQQSAYTGNDADITLNKQDSLIVRLSEGDTFNFTKSIDLTAVGDDGLCELITLDYRNVNFVPNESYEENVTPSWKKLAVKSNIATYCIIRLSDSYDLGKYVELYCRLSCPDNISNNINDDTAAKSDYYPYFSACAVGQVRTALTGKTSTEYATYYNITLDGEQYGLYYNNEKGGRSFSNVPLTGEHTPFTWKYDFKTNKIYIQQGTQVAIVSALSSSEIYGTNTFNGFSSGKVKLSVFMSEYVSGDKGRIDINGIGTYSGKELVENYGKLGFVDDVALPVIDLDITDTDGRGIYVPLGTVFSLPETDVLSNEPLISSSVYAYANYGKSEQLDIPIINGAIKINKDIQYTVIYKVENSAGCTGYRTLIINPVKTQNAITLDTSYESLGSIETGKKVVLPEFSLSTINKESALKVEIKAVHEKQTVKIDTINRTFIPSYEGEYTIVYECSDNVYKSVVYERKINCQVSSNVGFVGEFSLPRYFIKDAEYSLKAVPAFSFDSAEPNPIGFTAYVSYDNGESYQSIEDYKCVKITGSNTAIIKYRCEKGDSNAEIISNPIGIVDVGYGNNKNLRIRDYFVHDGFTSESYEESNSTDLQYDLDPSRNCGMLKFVNVLDLSSLNFTFKIPVNLSNYKKVNVILTDYYDSEITYTVSYIKKDGLCYVSLNGQKELATSYKFADNNLTKKLIYDSLNNILTLNDLQLNNINLLSIFNSVLCYIDVEIVDASGDSSIVIDSINLQKMSNNRKSDNVIPKIYVKDFSGAYEKDTVVTVYVPTVTDVLSPVVEKNIRVFAEKDGEVVYSVDGVRLDGYCDATREYQIKLDGFGKYTVSFEATDGAGKKATEMIIINVVDITKPTITLNVDKNVSVSKGKTFTLEYGVQDDISSAENISVNIFFTDLATNAFYTCNSNKIVFNLAGRYEVFIYAKDEAGNFAFESVIVFVKE